MSPLKAIEQSKCKGTMFHNQMVSDDEELRRLQECFKTLGDTVSTCLVTFVWAVEEFQVQAHHDGRSEHVVPLMLMLDFADSIDGVAILVRSGASKNCSQLLRTALEIQLALRYILEHKDTYERRCHSYEYFHLRDKLRWAQRCDPQSQVGKQLRAELAGDEFRDILDVPGFEPAEEYRRLESKMGSSRYSEVRDELKRMKAAGIRSPKWFELWGGPGDIRRLAKHLKLGTMYECLYRSYSSVSHGEAAITRLIDKEGKHVRVDPIRSPKHLPFMCGNACSMCNSMSEFVVNGLVPHLRDELRRRYISDIKPRLEHLDSVQGLSD